MIIKNKKMVFAGTLLIILSIYLGTIIGYSSGYIKTSQEQKDNVIIKYITIQNITVVKVPEIKEIIKEVPVEVIVSYTTTTQQSTTTTNQKIDLDNKTLTRLLNALKKEEHRGTSTPLPLNLSTKPLNAGRYFINQTVTFNRNNVAGVIPGQMIEIQEEEIKYRMSLYFNSETVFNVYIQYWNNTLQDITSNYTKYRTFNGTDI
jgi:hypothetical protein